MHDVVRAVLFKKDLAAGEKLLLLKLIPMLGYRPLPCTGSLVQQLSAGMKKSAYEKAFSSLVERKLLLVRDLPIGAGGASVNTLTLASALFSSRSQATRSAEPCYWALVKHILTCTDVLSLSEGETVLLVLLLFFCDETGVVRTLSRPMLLSVLGLKIKPSPETTRQQRARRESNAIWRLVGRLTQMGYLRRVTPGYRAVPFWGRSESAYFLNLSHPVYGSVAPSSVLLVDYGPWNSMRHITGSASDEIFLDDVSPGPVVRHDLLITTHFIASQQKKIKKSRSGRVNTAQQAPGYSVIFHQTYFPWRHFCVIFELFSGAGFRKAIPALQAKIERLAAILLSEHWEDVRPRAEQNKFSLRSALRSAKAISLFELKLREGEVSSELSLNRVERLTMWFLVGAGWCLAQRSKELLMQRREENHWQGTRFCILPSELSYGGFTGKLTNTFGKANANGTRRVPNTAQRYCSVIIALPSGQVADGAACFVTNHAWPDRFELETENDLTLSQATKYGVLSVNARGLEHMTLGVDVLPELGSNRPMRK